MLFVLMACVAIAVPAAAEDVLLIPESSDDGVMKFDPMTGAFLGYIIPPDPDHLSTPIDTEVNASGILVCDQIEDAVQLYSMAGVFLQTFASGIDNTRGMAEYDGKLYCTAGNADAIVHFDFETGTPLGDFIPTGSGGLDSPFDILFRADDVLIPSINSDDILRFGLDGTPLGVFAANMPFGEQMAMASNGNVLCADFTRDEIVEFLPDGTEIGAYPGVNGPRGCYELADGNILTTNGSGVFVVARDGSGVIATWYEGVSARFIQLASIGAVPVESTTWGKIKARFNN
jgi:hypothetical protein